MSVTTHRVLAWIKPWMVVASLIVAAAVGATAVYYAGEAQHRRDRSDILRWETRALPAATDASQLQQSLRASMQVAEIVPLRTRLQHDLDAITGTPLPEIVRPPAAAYAEAIRRTEASLEAIGTPSFGAAQVRAKAAFATAATAVQTLECRARLPACSSP